jgi:hypothetical protein
MNQDIRGRVGATITEAAIVERRRIVLEGRAVGFKWSELDQDDPAESPVTVWDDPGNRLNRDLLWEIMGPPGTATGSDETLRDHVLRELRNRTEVWKLMKDAVTAVQAGGTTPFMTTPVAAAQAAQCKDAAGNLIDLTGLMRILHMFGKPHSPHAPRPMHPITAGDYFYTTEVQVAAEITRRVHELAAGIPWEGHVKGGKEKKKPGVWNRYGMYCGCG